MKPNKLIRVMTALICEPWLLTPAMHKTLTDIVTAHATGGEPEFLQHLKAEQMKPDNEDNECGMQMVDGVAVIPVEGVIGRKFSSMLNSSGVCSVDVLEEIISACASDPRCDAMLLMMDTPGGSTAGLKELSDTMKRVAAEKPIVAYADGMMCSAGMWIACHANLIFATPSAEVGSIGVYMSLLDQSRAAEMAGLKVELFKSGTFKGMGMPGTSLTDEQRKLLQDRVDAIGTEFRALIRDQRKPNEISDDVMQGQSFDAVTAMKHGLIDGVTDRHAAMREAVRLGQMNKQRRRQ